MTDPPKLNNKILTKTQVGRYIGMQIYVSCFLANGGMNCTKIYNIGTYIVRKKYRTLNVGCV